MSSQVKVAMMLVAPSGTRGFCSMCRLTIFTGGFTGGLTLLPVKDRGIAYLQ